MGTSSPRTADAIRRRASATPQTQPLPGREREMKRNAAGGYGFKLPLEDRVLRFLILGTEGGTYYTSERKLTRQNAAAFEELLDKDAVLASKLVEEVSVQNRAPRVNATILCLAIMCAHPEPKVRQVGFALIPRVCRIGTHYFTFANYVMALRGWGRGLRAAVAKFYEKTDLEALAYQVAKYPGRAVEGHRWSHGDLVRLSHPNPGKGPRATLTKWLALGSDKAKLGTSAALAQLRAAENARREDVSVALAARLVKDFRLTHEMVNPALMREAKVAIPILATMPTMALVRNLSRYTKNGLLVPLGEVTRRVIERLDGTDWAKARVHPYALFNASVTYASGHGARADHGGGGWKPVAAITKALDKALLKSMALQEPLPGKILVAIDCSASMGWENASEKAAAYGACLAWNADVDFVRFDTSATPISVPRKPTPRVLAGLVGSGGGTDMAAPILGALHGRTRYDAIITLTDNEAWAGDVSVTEAQRRYLEQVNAGCRFVTVAFTATDSTQSDRRDPGSLEIVGFDASGAKIVESFLRSEF